MSNSVLTGFCQHGSLKLASWNVSLLCHSSTNVHLDLTSFRHLLVAAPICVTFLTCQLGSLSGLCSLF